ncbi:MAG: CBS domain-containing protein [Planctomycetia bacterium]|nr:CBS domain-containing protein [Planctomycetia bacterium]
MVATEQNLMTLTAADLMKHPVVTIPEDMSLHGAASLLQKEGISGAPVVNGEGRCVGVLSTTDFMKWAEAGGSHSMTRPEYCSEWQVIDLEMLPRDEVRHHMSIDVVSCNMKEPLPHLARLMLDAHIHRVFVLDCYRHPVGVVSSTDILAAVAQFDGAV